MKLTAALAFGLLIAGCDQVYAATNISSEITTITADTQYVAFSNNGFWPA